MKGVIRLYKAKPPEVKITQRPAVKITPRPAVKITPRPAGEMTKDLLKAFEKPFKGNHP